MLGDVRILIVPVVFLSSALTGNTSMMLILAFLAGFLWDCQHTLSQHTGFESIYSEKIESITFGYTIILYAVMGAITLGFTPLFRAGKWKIPAAVIGVTVYFYLWSEYLIINIVRGEFEITSNAVLKIGFTAALSTLLVPALLLMLGKFASLCNHTIKNDARRRFFNPDKV